MGDDVCEHCYSGDAVIEVYIRAWIFAGGGLNKRSVIVVFVEDAVAIKG